MHRAAWAGAALGVCLTLGACGVVPGGGLYAAEHLPLPCVINTHALIDPAQMPAGFTPDGPARTELGPLYGLHGISSYAGYVGNVSQYFRYQPAGSQTSSAHGASSASHPAEVLQIAAEISDWGTVSNAERGSPRATNQPNDIPDYGNGVERDPSVPMLGDDTFAYQIDYGAPYSSKAYTGPFVGHIYTNLDVRQGDITYAISMDSGPAIDSVSLTVSLMRRMLATKREVCGASGVT
jgi:hypothetical protein